MALRVRYEIFNNCFASLIVKYNHAQGFAPSSTPIASEDRGQTTCDGERLSGDALSQYFLEKYSPEMEQGKNVTCNIGLYYNF